MGIYVSPGVYTNEVNLSQVIPLLSTTTAAIVFASNQGDCTQILQMSNTQQFIAQYGTPVLGNPGHYSALAFLANGTQLWCYRVMNGATYGGVNIVTSTAGNASAAIPTGYVATTTAYPSFVYTSGLNTCFQIYAKDPGLWNNNIAVSISAVNASNYQFTITVYELVNGAYQVVETWANVSRVTGLNGYGQQQYFVTAINGFSNYIYVADSNLASSVLPKATPTNANGPIPLAMANGSNGSPVTDAQLGGPIGSGIGWDRFSSPENVDVRILIGAGAGGPLGPGGTSTIATQSVMLGIAQYRKDCIAIFDVPQSYCTNSTTVVNWATNIQNFNSSYCALYAPWVQIYDSYNATLVWLPPSGYVASQFAYNDYVANVWYAPAGLNRGVLNVLGVSPVWVQGDRDLLYANGVNPIQTFRGEGNVIWGQKTQEAVPSAINRVNVRRLLITLEKAIAIGLRSFVFEPNSSDTQFRIVAMCESYLDQLSAAGAFQTNLGDKGYKVVCNNTNNSPAVIDANQLNVDIYVKPSRAAEFIQLQVIVTPTGATFNELIANGFNLG